MQADVELLRVQVNGVVNNDDAMYPAVPPLPRRRETTTPSFSPRVLTDANRTDGFAGSSSSPFSARPHQAGPSSTPGVRSRRNRRARSSNSSSRCSLTRIPLVRELAEELRERFRRARSNRASRQSPPTCRRKRRRSSRLCANMQGYSHYKKIRFYILGLLAWLMSYLLKTACNRPSATPLLFFDFTGRKEGRIRSQSQACYARHAGNGSPVLSRVRRLPAGSIPTRSPRACSARRSGRTRTTDFKFLEEPISENSRSAWAISSPAPRRCSSKAFRAPARHAAGPDAEHSRQHRRRERD